MTFVYVGGRRCLDFVGTMKRRDTSREELLTAPESLSDWAVQAELLDHAIVVADDELSAAIAVREAGYRVIVARIGDGRLQAADVDLLNARAAEPQLTPRLLRNGDVRRGGTTTQLLASLAADVLELVSGPDIENVKRCAHESCTRLYLDSSRAKNRHWCGMSTCGNKAKVRAFRERRRAENSG